MSALRRRQHFNHTHHRTMLRACVLVAAQLVEREQVGVRVSSELAVWKMGLAADRVDGVRLVVVHPSPLDRVALMDLGGALVAHAHAPGQLDQFGLVLCRGAGRQTQQDKQNSGQQFFC